MLMASCGKQGGGLHPACKDDSRVFSLADRFPYLSLQITPFPLFFIGPEEAPDGDF